jgi:hypothetical protein
MIFWFVTQCILVGGHQRFGGTYHLPLQGSTAIEDAYQIFHFSFKMFQLFDVLRMHIKD